MIPLRRLGSGYNIKKKMWYDCQSDNSPKRQNDTEITNYRSLYNIQN